MTSTLRHSRYRLTFAVLAVAVGSFGLVQSLTIPVLPRITEELGTDQATVTWVLTAYLVSASIFTPVAGRIGDAVGKERILVATLLTLAAGSVVAALATDVRVLIAARVVQGIGGGVLPLAFGIVRDEFPEARIAGAVSFLSALMGAAAGVGTVLAGPIVDLLGYTWLFWLPAVATALAALVAWKVVPESPVRTPGRIPVLPTVLFAGALTALLIGISRGGEIGWLEAEVIGLLVAAAAFTVAWILVERRVPVPFIDLGMMRLRAVWTANVVAFLVGIGMYSAFAFIPQLVQTPPSSGYGLGLSVSESGVLMLSSTVGTFLMGIASAPLARRWGPKPVVVVGALMAGGGLVATGLAHGSVTELVISGIFIGIGIGAVFACLASIVVAAVPPEQTGVASGMNANIRTIGGAFGSAVMASIVTSHAGADGIPAGSGYTAGFLFLGGALLVAALVALAFPRMSPREWEDQLEAEPDPEHLVASDRG